MNNSYGTGAIKTFVSRPCEPITESLVLHRMSAQCSNVIHSSTPRLVSALHMAGRRCTLCCSSPLKVVKFFAIQLVL